MTKKNEKILDLSKFTDEQVDTVDKFIGMWCENYCAEPGLEFISTDDVQLEIDRMTQQVKNAYHRGVNDACVGSVIGIVACVGIIATVEYFKRKKYKKIEVVEE